MSIDKTIFLYDNLLNGDLFEHTQSISVGVHLYSSLFFYFSMHDICISRNHLKFYHFYSVFVSYIIENDNVENSLFFLVINDTVETME